MKKMFHMLREDARELARPVKPFTIIDCIAVLAAIVLMLFVFDKTTVVQTAGASFGYLNRRFADFYEYGRECGVGGITWMPLVYVIYALWNLPLKLTFLVRFPMPEVPFYVLLWYKLFLVLLYLACAWLVYRIALEIGMGLRKAKLCALAALTMPVGFCLQFSCGQIILIPVFFILLGLFFYLKNNRLGYVGCFAAAIGCLQYAWVIVLPLLLLKEKRLRQLCENIVLAGFLYSLQYLCYSRNIAFLQNVKRLNLNVNFAAGLNIGIFVIQYVVFFFILLLGWAYYIHARSKKELAEYAVFFASLSIIVTLCLTDWDAGYFMFLAPLSVLGAFLHKDIRIFMILDIGWAALLFACLALRRLEMGGTDMAASLYTVLLLVIAGFKHPSRLEEKAEALPSICTGWLRVRFLSGVLLYAALASAGTLLAMIR